MNHDPHDERLADWVDGRLTGADLARFEAELAADPALRAAAERYRRTVETLRTTLRGDERPRPGFADRVFAEGARRPAPIEEPQPRQSRLLPWIASAIAAAALVGTFLWIRDVADRTAPESVATAARDLREPPDAADFGRAPEDPAADPSELDSFEEVKARAPDPSLRAGGEAEPTARRGVDRGAGAAEDRAEVEGGPATARPVPAGPESPARADGVPDPAPAAARPETLVWLVELPDQVAKDALAAGEPAPQSGRDQSAGPAAWQRFAAGFVQAPAQTVTANVLTPQVEQLDTRVLALALTPAGGLPADAAPAEQQPRAGVYEPHEDDAAFQVLGDQQQVAQYLRQVLENVRRVGGTFAVQRTTFVPKAAGDGQAAAGARADTESRRVGLLNLGADAATQERADDDERPDPSVLIVLRSQKVAAEQERR